MPCIETLLGSETYFVVLTLVVGTLVNLTKRIPFVPSDGVPALAFILGWALDAAMTNMTCGLNYTAASLSGLGGGFAGLAAAGGHEALSRAAHSTGWGAFADRLLGKAKIEKDKRTSKTSTALLVVLVLFLSGCSSLLAALTKVQQGAQYLDTIVAVADAGADAYFARHPNIEAEQDVAEALRAARGSVAVLNGALAAAEAASDEGVERAREEALQAYKALRDLLIGLRVLSAEPPDGGAETDAPKPVPFELPEPGFFFDEVRP